MTDPRGYYQKYNITRKDGKPVDPITFTIEGHDPFAVPVLRLYADLAYQAGNFDLSRDLIEICGELGER